MTQFWITIFLVCFGTTVSLAQPTFNIHEKGNRSAKHDTSKVEYADDNFIRFQNFSYKPTIKTVRLHQAGLELSDPLIELGSSTVLEFSFDDLGGDIEDYYYTVILCNHDWQPSELDPMDYIEGFTENSFSDYTFSNGITDYTHYKLELPNEDMQLTKSGNYLLKVYLYGESESPIITRRFYVLSQKVAIEGRILRPGLLNYYQTHQEVDFTINHENLHISNAIREINVNVMQNGRWDNAVGGLEPKFIKHEQLVYDYNDEITFAAGKEFRYFDLRNLSFLKERVRDVANIAGETHAYLAPDNNRAFIEYIYRKDINGKYVIDAENETEAEVDAEYVQVHFNLPMDGPLTTGNIYIFGGLTDWNLTPEAKLTYNYKQKAYETQLQLKQGYYTYEYVFVEDGQRIFDTSVIEGDFYETENDYTIFIYFRPPGGRYDQFIGIETYNSLFGN